MAVRMKAGALEVAGADRWYVTDGANSVGPVRLDLLARGVEAGRVPLDSFVRHEAWKVWRPLTDFTDYVEEQKAPPLPQFPLPGDESAPRAAFFGARLPEGFPAADLRLQEMGPGAPEHGSLGSASRDESGVAEGCLAQGRIAEGVLSPELARRPSLIEFASSEGVPSRSSNEGNDVLPGPMPVATAMWSDPETELDGSFRDGFADFPDGSTESTFAERGVDVEELDSPTDVSRDLLGADRRELAAAFNPATQDTSTQADSAQTHGKQPAVTRPAVTQPAVTRPAVTQPAVTRPAVTQPVGARVTDPQANAPPVEERVRTRAAPPPGAPPLPLRARVASTEANEDSPRGAGPSPALPKIRVATGLLPAATDDIPRAAAADAWGAARPADSADALPEDDLAGAADLSDALLLLLGGVIKRTKADVAVLFRMEDDGARIVCAHGPEMLSVLGDRAGSLDASVVAASTGDLVLSEPTPGPVGRAMMSRFEKLGISPISAVLLSIRVRGQLLGFLELGRGHCERSENPASSSAGLRPTPSGPFTARQVVKAEDLVLAFVQHVTERGFVD